MRILVNVWIALAVMLPDAIGAQSPRYDAEEAAVVRAAVAELKTEFEVPFHLLEAPARSYQGDRLVVARMIRAVGRNLTISTGSVADVARCEEAEERRGRHCVWKGAVPRGAVLELRDLTIGEDDSAVATIMLAFFWSRADRMSEFRTYEVHLKDTGGSWDVTRKKLISYS